MRPTWIDRRMVLLVVIASIALGGCATHSEKLLPRGERTMLDIWQHETGGGPGNQAGHQLLDARQSQIGRAHV